MIKNWFVQTKVEKLYGIKKGNQAKLERVINILYLLLPMFLLLLPKFYICKGDWVPGYVAKLPKTVWKLKRELVCKVFYTRYQILFYLWRIKAVLKCCKVQK